MQWRLVVFFFGGQGFKNWVWTKICSGKIRFLKRNKLSGFSLDVSQYFVKSSLRCFLHVKTSNVNNNPD